MIAERRDRMHERGIVHPHAVGSRQAAAWAVDEKTIAGLLLRRHLLDGYFGVAAEGRGVRHRVSSSSGLNSDVLRYVQCDEPLWPAARRGNEREYSGAGHPLTRGWRRGRNPESGIGFNVLRDSSPVQAFP